jgi:Xaa-Pro aminopeptidase
LSVQKAIIEMVKPGLAYEVMHARCSELLCDGLIALGHLKGTREENIKNGELKRLFPHGTGHLLGMDVHDVGLYKINGKSRALEPGMVFTVEPGLYYQTYDQKAPEAFRGIGIRIEDNILVTETGYRNLTESAPKERAEIEALRARAL